MTDSPDLTWALECTAASKWGICLGKSKPAINKPTEKQWKETKALSTYSECFSWKPRARVSTRAQTYLTGNCDRPKPTERTHSVPSPPISYESPADDGPSGCTSECGNGRVTNWEGSGVAVWASEWRTTRGTLATGNCATIDQCNFPVEK